MRRHRRHQMRGMALAILTAVSASLSILALLALPAVPAAAEPAEVGVFSNWSAYTDGDDANKICYAYAQPTRSEPASATRGDIYFIVTRREGPGVQNEVSLRAGYVFNDTSKPYAQIGSQKFQMYSGAKEGGERAHWAWLLKPDQEESMVEAMKRGSVMLVKGTSNRKTLTTDHYSLSGITAALKAADEACS